jgi:hypothetical protein
MRRITTCLTACLVALIFGVPATAQEDAAPTLISIQEFEVAPAHMSAFESAVEKIVQAAGQAELDNLYRWSVYQKDDVYFVVDWPSSMADFDDEEAWYRQFAGTPGEATLNEAFDEMASLDMAHRMWVDQEMAEFNYEPSSPMDFADHGGVWIATEWWRMGDEDGMPENTERVTALLEEIDFAYPVIFNRNRVGEGGRVSVIVPFDTPANLYGSNSLQAALAQADAGEEWGRVMEERYSMLRDVETGLYTFRGDLSYLPEESM